jgi:hypothetical protein
MSCCSSRPRRSPQHKAAPVSTTNADTTTSAAPPRHAAPAAPAAAAAAAAAPAPAEPSPATKPVGRTTTAEVKRVRAEVKVAVPVGASAVQADTARRQARELLEATKTEQEAVTESVPPSRTASVTKDALIEQLRGEQTPSWMNSSSGPSTPQSVRSTGLSETTPVATPKSMPPPPPAMLKTPDWLAVLKQQGLAAGSVTDSMRQPVTAPPPSAAKSMQGADESIAEEDEDSSASEEEQEWHSVREIPQEQLSPAAAPAVDPGTLLCKIDVEFNTKFGEWNNANQGKLYAQMIAAGTDEMFAKKVVMAMKENKGKVSVRGPMVNHGPAFTVFRSIPALSVGLQTPSKVDQSSRRHGKAAPPPLRTAGPCAVTRLPGQPKPKQKPAEKPKDSNAGKGGGFLRRNKKGIPIVKARTISPPRASASRSSSASSSGGVDPPALPTTRVVKPIPAARSLFDRNGRPRSDPNFMDTPISRSSSTDSNVSVYTPASARVLTPKIGVRALRSPARLVAESFERGVNLQGREFKVLTASTVTKLVMPSSSDVATLQPGQLVTAIDNQWWHGPRIKLQLPAVDGSGDGGTGWASLCSTHGDYLLIPVVDAAAASDAAEQQEGDENTATNVYAPTSAAAEGLGTQIPARKTARRALGMVQAENGSSDRRGAAAMSTPDARAAKLATNSRPVSTRVTPGRDGDI